MNFLLALKENTIFIIDFVSFVYSCFLVQTRWKFKTPRRNASMINSCKKTFQDKKIKLDNFTQKYYLPTQKP